MPGLLLDQRLLLLMLLMLLLLDGTSVNCVDLLLSNSGPSRKQSTPGTDWTEDLASWRVDDIPSLVQHLLLEARRWHAWSPDGLLLPIF